MTTSGIKNILDSIIKNPKSTDYEIASEISRTFLTSCSYHTSPSNLNRASAYEYANNPGIYSCSSPSRKTGDGQPLTCVYALSQYDCPLFKPDFTIIRKVKTSSDNIYYLTRFRIYDGSYFYKMYDSSSKVYSELKYTQIQMENDNLNLEAVSLFEKFLNDLSVEYTHDEIAEDSTSISEQKQTNSYLKTLVTKD